MSDLCSTLLARECSPFRSVGASALGFQPSRVSSFELLSAAPRHNGCINTLTMTNDGRYLVSGSDDRLVKLWDISGAFEDEGIKLQHTIRTGHRNNIFAAEISPHPVHNQALLLTCAADGHLRKNIINERFGEVSLLSSSSIIHTFAFDLADPMVVYTAEEAGVINRVDLRAPSHEVIFANVDGAGGSPRCVKAVKQHENLGPWQLIVGGQGLVIKQLDLRLISNGGGAPVQLYGPHFNCMHNGRSAINTELRLGETRARQLEHVSISGLDVSKDGRTLLASYQGDQIYTFPLGVMSDAVGATRSFGGHRNYATFLKQVCFFGPRDDYICSGSDSGHLWIWNARRGILPDDPDASSPDVDCVALLKADDMTCNGVCPHPALPVIASYGIDSTAKIWGYRGGSRGGEGDEDEVEVEDEECHGPEVVRRLEHRLADLESKLDVVRGNLLVGEEVGEGIAAAPTLSPVLDELHDQIIQLQEQIKTEKKNRARRLLARAKYCSSLKFLPAELEESFALIERSRGGMGQGYHINLGGTVFAKWRSTQGRSRHVFDTEQFTQTVYALRRGKNAAAKHKEFSHLLDLGPDYPSDLRWYCHFECKDWAAKAWAWAQSRLQPTSMPVMPQPPDGAEDDSAESLIYFSHMIALEACFVSQLGLAAKENGNAAFRAGNETVAALFYEKAIRYSDHLAQYIKTAFDHFDLRLSRKLLEESRSSTVGVAPERTSGSDAESVGGMGSDDDEDEDEDEDESEEVSQGDGDNEMGSASEQDDSEDEGVVRLVQMMHRRMVRRLLRRRAAELEGRDPGNSSDDDDDDNDDDDNDDDDEDDDDDDDDDEDEDSAEEIEAEDNVGVEDEEEKDSSLPPPPPQQTVADMPLAQLHAILDSSQPAPPPLPVATQPATSSPSSSKKPDPSSTSVVLMESVVRPLFGEVSLAARSNLVHVAIRRGDHRGGLRIGELALRRLKDAKVAADHKLLYRVGCCALNVQRHDQAVELLESARAQCPPSAEAELRAIDAKLKEAKAAEAAERKKEARQYKRMFV